MNVVLLVVSILLIIIVLLQSGKAESASNVIMGGNAELFSNRKERGGELFVSRLTMVLGVIFFCLCVFLSFLTQKTYKKVFLFYNVIIGSSEDERANY